MPHFDDYALRSIRLDDKSRLFAWRNDDLIHSTGYSDHKISPQEHSRWFENALSAEPLDHHVFVYKGRPIGFLNFSNIDEARYRAFFGMYIGERRCPVGSGAFLELAALDCAFLRRGLEKLCCQVFAFNQSVIHMHKRFGFIEEGLFRAHIMKSGRPIDVIQLFLFKTGWQETRPKILDMLR